MRGLIVDYARNRRALKRGGAFEITALDTNVAEAAADQTQIVEIGEALDALAAAEPALAQLVDLKFFCGFSFGEIAAMRGVSERTVQRDWEKARIYLRQTLREEAP
jgi:RNA polymerase sigma factor (TIGR02999 family)